MSNSIEVFDTTLRDGNQALESRLNVEGKLHLVQELDRWGVDYIEGGWPESNPTDREFFLAARGLVLSHAILVAFGRTRKAGIRAENDDVLQNLLQTETPVVTLYGKSSVFQVTQGLRVPLEENLRMIYDSVLFLKNAGRKVIYDAEHFFDGWGEDPEYAESTLKVAIEAGAQCLVLCDTNGGSVPEFVSQVTYAVRRRFPLVQLGIHPHNDYDLATANTLAAVNAGATQVQGVVNGNGERAGNADLIVVLKNLADHYGIRGGVDLSRAYELSKIVAEETEIPVPPNHPITGEIVFTHNAGTHVLNHTRNPRLQSKLDPESVGREVEIGFTDQGGGTTVLAWAEKLKFPLSRNDPEFNLILQRMKQERIFGVAQIYCLFDEIFRRGFSPFKLMDRSSVRRAKPVACLRIEMKGEIYEETAEGVGLIDAFDHALRNVLSREYPGISEVQLVPGSYRVNVSPKERGTAAAVEVFLKLVKGKHVWSSRVRGSDQVWAGEEAFIAGYRAGILAGWI